MPSPSGSNSTQLITLGIFLKILGFFVVLVSYAELEPIKTRQVENSLRSQFGMNLLLPIEKGGVLAQAPMIVQQSGRSYDVIREKLMTQIDFLSAEDVVLNDRLTMTLPAAIVLALDSRMPKSPQFAQQLADVLTTQKPELYSYTITLTGTGGAEQEMMRGLGDFAQKLIATGYPAQKITISYDNSDHMMTSLPQVMFAIQAVKP
jgi:hypothetical protein